MKTIENIEKLKQEIGIPYIDVVCYREHQEIFRYFTGENVTGKELLYMYSCSKPITAVTAMQAIEKGLFSLDDKVCDYLPEIAQAFIINENGKKIVGEEMTIRHLFTMSAGFTYDLWTPPILELAQKSNGTAKLRDFISAFVKTPLAFAPGERFEYSICLDVLAAVVEKAAGRAFSQCVAEQVFQPLEMHNSRFDNSEGKVADIYLSHADGSIHKIDEGKILLPTRSYESGGAGLVSSVEDYIRFADALACGGVAKDGARILKEESICQMTEPQKISLSVNNTFTCIQGDDYAYGLGVRVRKNPTAWGLEKGEYGWDGAAGSYVLIDPKRKISVFIGMHLREWPFVFRGRHLEIVKSLYEEFFSETAVGEKV